MVIVEQMIIQDTFEMQKEPVSTNLMLEELSNARIRGSL